MIEQLIGQLPAAGWNFTLYYFRTSDQFALDIVLDIGRELWAVEIERTSPPSTADMNRLNRVADMVRADRPVAPLTNSEAIRESH